jgi:hypothetical protein
MREWVLFALAHVLMHGIAAGLKVTGHDGFWFFLWCIWLPFACFQFFWFGDLLTRIVDRPAEGAPSGSDV